MARRSRTAQPLTPWLYGLLGLIPFGAGALGAMLPGKGQSPGWRTGSLSLLMIYGGLILSFLGGARWGLEIARAKVRARVIGLSMLPTLAAFFLMFSPAVFKPFWQFMGLASAFVAQWAWDVSSRHAPGWYPRLRSVLTAGAVFALVIGAFRT